MIPQNLTVYKLKLTSPLHISRGRDDDDYSKSHTIIHSDTLKSALFSTAILLKPELQKQENGQSFFNSFLLSSAFPYYKDTLFLPKPKGKLPITNIKDNEPSYDFKKELKKVDYIDIDLFLQLFNASNNKLINTDDIPFKIIGEFIVKPDFEKKEDLKIYKSEVQERVYIRKFNEIYDPNDKKYIFSDPFIVDKIYFMENTGLYFILVEKENFDKNFFKNVLEHLGVFGIGTDRNVGNGHFVIEKIDTINLTFTSNTKYLMNLSLYLPTKSEVENFTNACQYKIIKRGGWISNIVDLEMLKKGQLKKSVYMIEEASVFENNFEYVGKLVDLRTENINHPVWREGRSLFVPINNII